MRKQGIKGRLKFAALSIAVCGLIALATSCKKEEPEVCRDCTYVTSYEDLYGNQYNGLEEEVKYECGNPQNGSEEMDALWQIEHPLIKDSLITFIGTRTIVKRCR